MNPYEDTEYLRDRWDYSDLEMLYQELNNLTNRRICQSNYHSGLIFKPVGSYLTLAGLRSGDAGWYMTICWDNYKINVADRHATNVIRKAIYWFTEMMQRKPTDRKITESFMAGDEWKTIASEDNSMPTAKD